jgi:DNA polymerase III sliding clamp (beta) subunit (PCNA family)
MKVIIPTPILRHIEPVISGITGRQKFAVLNLVRITAAVGMIRFEATDLDQNIIFQIGEDSDAPTFDAWVEWDRIKECAKRDTLEIEITSTEDGHDAVIRSTQKGVAYKITPRVALPGSPDAWPSYESVIKGCDSGWFPVQSSFQVDYKDLIPASSTDETRYVLQGVLLDLNAKVLIATDGKMLHRIQWPELADVPKASRGEAIIPIRKFFTSKLIDGRTGEMRLGSDYDYDSRDAEEAARKLKKGEKRIDPTPVENRMLSTLEYRTTVGPLKVFYWTKLIEGNYPNWKVIVDSYLRTTSNSIVTFADPVEALKALRTLNPDKTIAVKIDAQPTSATLSVKKPDADAAVEIKVFATAPAVVSIQAKLLDYALAHGFVRVEIEDSESPVTFIDSRRTLIVMPMRTVQPLTTGASSEEEEKAA